MSWLINPAVRDPKGQCIEEADCSWEAVTLCAFNQTETADHVSFLACMDEKDAKTVGAADEALTAAEACAEASHVDATVLTTCYHGAQSQELLEEASVIWNKAFPQRATVPHTFVNTEDVQADYNDLKDALCKAGSSASVCKKAAAPKAKACSI